MVLLPSSWSKPAKFSRNRGKPSSFFQLLNRTFANGSQTSRSGSLTSPIECDRRHPYVYRYSRYNLIIYTYNRIDAYMMRDAMSEPEETTRLTITWSKEADHALRSYLGAQGMKKGDL